MAVWEQVYKSSGIKPEGLKRKPDKPIGLEEVSALYLDIKRGADGVGYREINAYQEVTGHKINPFIRNLILDIDGIRRKHHG